MAKRSAGSVEIFKIMYVVPKIPISGRILPSGTLKERGAFGTLFLRISTSICAKIYEIIQNTEPTRIKNEIAEEELSLIKAKNQNGKTDKYYTEKWYFPFICLGKKLWHHIHFCHALTNIRKTTYR